MAEAKKRLVIIDGKSVFYRGYYAMPNLSTKDGTPTGGVYGFAVMALEVIKRLKPDYVCVAWDKPKTNIRKRLAIYPAYKAGRKPAPPDFYDQIPLLHELLEAFGWPLYELDDYEADDIMGTLSVQAREKGLDTALVTSDLDMLQVINGNVHVYALKKGLSSIELFHPESFKEKYGIDVDQFLDLKSLKGDSSDNIPGAPGIGEKTAVELLKEHKTLDGIYDNLALIKDSTKKKLEAGRELVEVSKKLAAIWTDAPIKLNLSEVDGSKCDPKAVAEKLQKFEFRTLARQLPDVMKLSPEDIQTASSELKLGKLNFIDNQDDLENIDVDSKDPALFHTYCRGAHGGNAKYLLYAQKPSTTYLIDCDTISGEHIRRFLERLKKVSLIGFDLKTAIKAAYSFDVDLVKVEHDVFVAGFLINPLRRGQLLGEIARADIDYGGPDLDNISPDEFKERAAIVSSALWSLHEQQRKQLKKLPKMNKLAREIEWPLTSVLADMEYRGVRLDVDYLKHFDSELKDMLSDIQQEIYGHANQEFNIASPAQLADTLFDKMQLPTQGIKRGKTGYSTASSELDKLRGVHPIINLITKYREVSKLMNTYVEPLPSQVDHNSRLHTTYNLAVAPTGRLSSEKPNLQNIPIRTELGKRIRRAFVAGEGNVLISADYSQIELRVAAVLSGDKDMIDMFNRDVDIHTATAAQVYGRQAEDVTKNMRRDAKVINFGILYGMSPHGLSVATGMTIAAAKEFIDKYFELRKPLLAYLGNLREQAKEQGYVETLFGRRRPTPDVKSSNFVVRQAAERAAINMPIQGTAADVMKLAMIHIQKMLESKKDSHMLLQIHDAVLLECPQEDADELARELKECMENVYDLGIKLTVDTSIGKNWSEL